MENSLLYTSFDPTLQFPIAFNGWKHHLRFLVNASIAARQQNMCSSFVKHLKNFGGTVLDVYTGLLSCKGIADELVDYLCNLGILTHKQFTAWLKCDGETFKQVELSDGSVWTITYGRFPQRFVHIHPSRLSPNTLRVKPSTLKTAIAYHCFYGCCCTPNDLEKVNDLRVSQFELSPVNRITINGPLFRLTKIINDLS